MISLPDLPTIKGVPVDLVLNFSEPNPQWKILEKTSTFGSIGKFRSDLGKLKVLRGTPKGTAEKINPVSLVCGTVEKINAVNLDCTDEAVKSTTEVIKPNINRALRTIQFAHKPKTYEINASTPSNPLIDQTIRIYKPTEWIDCISRESKRIFVKDNWIVARILLPPVSKDSIGLKRLTLE